MQRAFRHTPALGLVTLVALVAACSRELPTAPRGTPVSAARSEPHYVPFKGNLEGDVIARPPCPGTSKLGRAGAGSGELTHLGAYTVEFSNCPAATRGIAGHFAMTAANGDEIFGTYTQGVRTSTGAVEGTDGFVITGGTGRFENASGGGTLTIVQVGRHVSGSLDGVISSVGSSE